MELHTVITEHLIPIILAYENEPNDERPHIREDLTEKHERIVRSAVGHTFGDLVESLVNFDCEIMQFWDLEKHEYRQWLKEHYEAFDVFAEEYKLNPSKD